MFEHTRGDSWRRAWIFKEQDKDPVTGELLFDAEGNPVKVPKNITGAKARLHLRAPDGTAVIKASVGWLGVDDKYMSLTPEEGRLDLNVPGEDMCHELATYRYDTEVRFADGVTVTVDKNSKMKLVEDQTYDD